MNDFDINDDQLADYLTARMPDDQRREIEKHLQDNEELKATLAETRMMAIGLVALNSISAGHVDSKLLVQFCDTPDQLDTSTREEITRHLTACANCREEVILCQELPTEKESSKGLFLSMVTWLFAPKLTFRPAIVVALCLLLVLPTTYYMNQQQEDITARVELSLASTSRDVLARNMFEVSKHVPVVRLSCVIPAFEGRTYRIELCDSTDHILLVKPDNPAQNLLALDVPTSYLHTGTYNLRIVELGSDALPTDTLVFVFKLRLADN